MTSVAITGANGFIGRHLSHYLSKHCTRVVCLTTSSAPPLSCSSNIQYISIDYSDHSSFCEALNDCDVLIHLASIAHINTSNKSPQMSYHYIDTNLTLLISALSAARATTISQFIFLSSIGVYGDQFNFARAPIDENFSYKPCHAYSLSKAVCENYLSNYCLSHGLDWTILQPPLVYSQDAPGNFRSLYEFVSSSYILPFSGVNTLRSYISIGNLCSAINLCVLNSATFNDKFILSDCCDISLSFIQKKLSDHFKRRYYVSLPLIRFLNPLFTRLPVFRFYWNKLNAKVIVSCDKFSTRTGWLPPEPPFSNF